MVPVNNGLPARFKLVLSAALITALGVGASFLVNCWNTEIAKKQSTYNLDTWFAYGMKGYSDYQGKGRMIPQAICNEQGKPLLSWRVAILPYIEQVVLFKKFNLDEPWDSPHNITLLAEMPHMYESPHKNNPPGETFYQVFTGPGSAFPNPHRDPPFFAECANKLLVVEARNSVPWTKPVDLNFEQDGPLPTLGGVFGEGRFLAVFGDRTVRWYSHPSEVSLRSDILGKK